MVMLRKITNNGFNSVYTIMENSFPTNEIRSYIGQYNLLKNSNYSLFAREENGEIVGFIATWDLVDFTFIEHFAVSEKHRGKGLGSEILDEIKLLNSKPLVLEVEPPIDVKTAKRIAFYEKNGLIFHDFYYVQPAMEKGKDEVELRIMSTQKLDKDGFEKVRKVLYKEIYKRDA